MSDKTILQLIFRLNEITVEMNKLEVRNMQLEKEYDDIVYELWGKIPDLKNSEDIQPKRKVRRIDE